jgi:predicted SAM-dependent methyltransferase
MSVTFNIDLQNLLDSGNPIELELGAAGKKNGRISIDHLNLPGVDIVANLEEGLPFFPDNSVDAIYSKSFLEHIDNLGFLMQEIWRVLKPDGKKHLFVPHFSNPYYYSDYTHQRFFGLYTFEYFSNAKYGFTRQVPQFYNDHKFAIENIKLVFKSPWKYRNRFRKNFGKLINSSKWWQEFYEENLCYIIPCYGIEATLTPNKTA